MQGNQAILNKDFWTAAKDGALETCIALLDRGADVDAVGERGDTALSIAACAGHEAVCRLLIERGADVNKRDIYGASLPLMEAVEQNRPGIIRLLLEHGADVNAVDNFSQSSLMIAARESHLGACRLLIAHGAQLDLVDREGWTALTSAANHGHVKACQILIAAGADLNVADTTKYNWTALTRVAYLGKLEVCRVLVEGGADLKAESDGLTAFQRAVRDDKKLLVQYFLEECEEDPWQKTSRHGHTMMRLAKSIEVKELLRSAKTQMKIKKKLDAEVGELEPVSQPSHNRRSFSPL